MVTLKREERYTVADFLSICGGLLVLFLGISVLRIFEFIYYFSLRWFCTLRQQKSQKNIVRPMKSRTINSIYLGYVD